MHAGNLLSVDGEIVSENAGSFRRSYLGESRDVIQKAGDVVDQREEAGSCHEGATWDVDVSAVMLRKRPLPRVAPSREA